MKKSFIAILLGSLILESWVPGSALFAQDVGKNLILNSTFDANTEHWNVYRFSGGVSTTGLEDGKLKVAIKDCGQEPYSVQVCYLGFGIYQHGKYHLEFDMSSSKERTVACYIQFNGGDYQSYAQQLFKVGKEMKTFSLDFTMKHETDLMPSLCFNLGKLSQADLESHDVKIDNVKLYLVDDSKIDYGEEEKEKKIAINQVGYKNGDSKIAVFKGGDVGSRFKVIDASSKEVVYENYIYGTKYNEASKEITSFGDFTAVTKSGCYQIIINDGEEENASYPFMIGRSIYNGLFRDAFRFFYLQRCGQAIPSSLGDKWAHKTCHTQKARIYGTNKMIDVSGGWHDAGDYGRYVVSSATAVADLLYAYEENKQAFGDNLRILESGNGVSDLLDEVRYQLEWLLKMQNPENGGVYHKVTCAKFSGCIMPEDEKDELIVAPISTAATGDFAAVMAMGYEHFKKIDSDFANRCLGAAKKAWDYLEKTPSSSFTNPKEISTGEYADDSDYDERYWAAAQLFRATGDGRYHTAFKKLISQGVKFGYGWETVGGFGNKAYLSTKGANKEIAVRIRKAIINKANNLVETAKNDGYGVAKGTDYYWGSNMSIMNNAILLAEAYKLEPNDTYIRCAKEHINYCLGKNSLTFSFVTSYGANSVMHPHHPRSEIVDVAIPGMLVGGPNRRLQDSFVKAYKYEESPARCYIDCYGSSSTNEVTIYWNAALVFALTHLMNK